MSPLLMYGAYEFAGEFICELFRVKLVPLSVNTKSGLKFGAMEMFTDQMYFLLNPMFLLLK